MQGNHVCGVVQFARAIKGTRNQDLFSTPGLHIRPLPRLHHYSLVVGDSSPDSHLTLIKPESLEIQLGE